MPKTVTRPVETLGGGALREMFAQASALLATHVEAVNALNVFPVPDGDTGTNMLLTMRSALAGDEQNEEASASGVLNAMARGALMGARGNSGVILSQILRGLSRAAEGKANLRGGDLAHALDEAAKQAYTAVTNPVEGTILTVIRDVASAVEGRDEASPAEIFELATAAAKTSVARTPFLLEILRENGVVDAGGQGLALLLEGSARYLSGGEPIVVAEQALPKAAVGAVPAGAPRMASYGFCTEFLVTGQGISVEDLRACMIGLGDSVLVVGDTALVKVHLHTRDPDAAVAYAESVATVADLKVDDIDAQHQDFAARHATQPIGPVAVVAVCAGDGFTAILKTLGASAIIPGGQTMNPSAQDILDAVRSVPAQSVIVMPNNPNVIPAARQVTELEPGKEVLVLPTRDLPEAVTALTAFNYERDPKANFEAMERALGDVKTGSVTHAVRDAKLAGKKIRKGQPIGLIGGTLAVADEDLGSTLERLLKHLRAEENEVITLYYGASVSTAEAQAEAERLAPRFPDAEVDAVSGGQPHYDYLIALE